MNRGRLNRRLTVSRYFKERGVPLDVAHQFYSKFGRQLRQLYIAARGKAPGSYTRPFNGGAARGNGYTEADRPLFDVVWLNLEMDQYLI